MQERAVIAGPGDVGMLTGSEFGDGLVGFDTFGTQTQVRSMLVGGTNGRTRTVATLVNEFWTSQQRKGHSLHEISYRACFKPELPKFFIERLTEPGDVVYDPFMGRGTTPLEAALLDRTAVGCDVNPLSRLLTAPRLVPPNIEEVEQRLDGINFYADSHQPRKLRVFYHPDTLREICALKEYLRKREASGELDSIDEWIRMVAVCRLTGHSPGFFSVYSLPPNQAVSVEAQRKINKKRRQRPPRRDVPTLILRKTKTLLAKCSEGDRDTLEHAAESSILLTESADRTPEIRSESVTLVVTSPPFLDVVDYARDNWLRCWFCGIDEKDVEMTILKSIEEWQAAMTDVFSELSRVLVPGGYVAFEVGEIRGGTVKLEKAVAPCGLAAGLEPVMILINDQRFTKTAHLWGIDNGIKGTNTNRIVLFYKPK